MEKVHIESLGIVEKISIGTLSLEHLGFPDYNDESEIPIPDYMCATGGTGGVTLNLVWNGDSTPDVKVSEDGLAWQTLDFTFDEGVSGYLSDNITLAEGEKCYFKGTNACHCNGNDIFEQFSFIDNEGVWSLSGDPGTLIDEVGGEDVQLLEGALADFCNGCSGLTSIDGLVLPAKNLSISCYVCMFSYCDNLSDIGNLILPSKNLTYQCYAGFLSYCRNVTQIPSTLLPSDVVDNTLDSQDYVPALDGMLDHIGASSIPQELSDIITGLGYDLDTVYVPRSPK